MTSFQSRWDTWEPAKTPIQCTDRTDKSHSVSNVSSSDRDIPAKIGLTTPLGQIAASKLPPTKLVPEDWRSFYEERAAILEHDGGLDREKAERLAFEVAVVGLSNAMATNHPQDTCAACGSHVGHSAGLPLADKAIVCDNACHTQHRQQQRERAERQLAGWGIGLDE